jgi:hypothetical protein
MYIILAQNAIVFVLVFLTILFFATKISPVVRGDFALY